MGHYLMLSGAVFVAIAALGVLRLPDLFARMHSSTKAGTLGLGLILCGMAIQYTQASILIRSIATIIFVVLTAPVSAHLVGRAAYYTGVPLWKGTVTDEMEIM